MYLKQFITLPLLLILTSCLRAPSHLDFKQIFTLKGHTKDIWSVSFSPSGKELLSGSADTTIKVWDMENGNLKNNLLGHKNSVYGLAFNKKGDKFVSASYDGIAKVWDNKTKKRLISFKEHMLGIEDILFTADGRVVTASQDRTIKIWDSKTGGIYKDLQVHKTVRIRTKSLSLNPNGREFACSTTDSKIRIWDIITGEELKTKSLDSGALNSISYSPDGNLIATGGADKSVRVFNTKNLEQIKELRGHSWNVNAIAFSPDGSYLVSGSTDKTIVIWDTRTWENLGTYNPQVGVVNTISFSSNNLVAVGGIENTVSVFNFKKKNTKN